MSVKNVEALAVEIYRECEKEGEPVSMAEAVEMAEMECRASESRHYEKSVDAPKKKKSRPRKVDEEKGQILKICSNALVSSFDVQNVEIETETVVRFSLNGNNYSLKLTKHRK